MSIWINLFHIIVVASLICMLAKRLRPGNEYLQNTAYAFVFVMVVYHAMKVWKKLGKQ